MLCDAWPEISVWLVRAPAGLDGRKVRACQGGVSEGKVGQGGHGCMSGKGRGVGVRVCCITAWCGAHHHPPPAPSSMWGSTPLHPAPAFYPIFHLLPPSHLPPAPLSHSPAPLPLTPALRTPPPRLRGAITPNLLGLLYPSPPPPSPTHAPALCTGL